MPKGARPNLGPAVDPVTRELRYTSVSALASFDTTEYGGCPRRWYLRYVMRLPVPQTKNQAEGEQGHSQIEHFLTTGQDVLGPALRVGRHLLPEPGGDLEVERELKLLKADGVPVIGSIDWVHRRGVYVHPASTPSAIVIQPDPPNTVEVGDNKTTSNLIYAKTAEEIETGTQMIGYAQEMALEFPDAEWIRLSHTVFQLGKSRGT